MRIMAISNLYPPHAVGGYEQGCRDVMEGLVARGHEACVLTSTYGTGKESKEQHGDTDPVIVHRRLYCHWRPERPWHNLWELASIERQGLNSFHSLLHEYRPDVISLWNMGGLSESLITAAQNSGLPIVFHISDEWPRRLGGDPWLHFWCRRPRRPFKRPVKTVLVSILEKAYRQRLYFQMPNKRFSTCQFVSDFLRKSLTSNGLQVDRAEVIRWGVRPSTLRTLPGSGGNGAGLSLLYLGQIVPHKGPHIALEALSLLSDKMDCRDISLTLAGTAPQPDYLLALRKLVDEKGLSSRVRFLPAQPRERLTEFCRQYDLFLFPSIWEEPFSIVLLEAMAAGLPVIATATGGTPEVIRDRENGLLCHPDNPAELAEKIEALVWNRSLRHALAQAAQETVRRDFNFNAMIERVEKLLLSEGGNYAAGN